MGASLYEPINVYKPLAPDIGIVGGPLGGIRLPLPFTTRMTVVRLSNGDLFLHCKRGVMTAASSSMGAFVDLVCGMICDAVDDVGKLGLRVETGHFAGFDNGVDDSGTLHLIPSQPRLSHIDHSAPRGGAANITTIAKIIHALYNVK